MTQFTITLREATDAGRILKRARVRAKWSIKKLAKQTNLYELYLRRVEDEGEDIRVGELVKCLQAMGFTLTVSWLMPSMKRPKENQNERT